VIAADAVLLQLFGSIRRIKRRPLPQGRRRREFKRRVDARMGNDLDHRVLAEGCCSIGDAATEFEEVSVTSVTMLARRGQ
jgi:hypothetical protein